MRCDVATADTSATVCQLYVGHDGEHAAAVLVDADKLLRRWSDPLNINDTEFVASQAATLAWAPGYPIITPAVAIEQRLKLALVDDKDVA